MAVKVRLERDVKKGNNEEFVQDMKRERVGPNMTDFEFD